MAASIAIACPEGDLRDSLATALAGAGVDVACAGTDDPASLAGLAEGRDAVVHLPGGDPFVAAGDLAAGSAGRFAEAAAGASARYLFCSTVLIYEDGGDDELTAGDPELDPPAALQLFADAELEVFASPAEVMVLRLGVLLVPGGTAARTLAAAASAALPAVAAVGHRGSAERAVHLPLLDVASLAGTLAVAAASSLHGAWDVVAACPTSDQLFPHVSDLAPRSSGPVDDGGEWLSHVWGTSRFVTGDALREAGAPLSRDWREIVGEALS